MNKEQRKTVDDYTAYLMEANRMRGEILNNCINLERWLDVVLAYYFCEDNKKKRTAFLSKFLVSGRVVFKSKVAIFKSIVDTFPSTDQGYFREAIKDLNDRIIPARNAIAHRALQELDFKESYEEKKTVYKDVYSDAAFEIDNWDFAMILKSTSDYTGRLIGLVNFLEMAYTQPPL